MSTNTQTPVPGARDPHRDRSPEALPSSGKPPVFEKEAPRTPHVAVERDKKYVPLGWTKLTSSLDDEYDPIGVSSSVGVHAHRGAHRHGRQHGSRLDDVVYSLFFI
ncbi:hypothetical protein ACKKBG_A09275 [Auxenochlorella protothecoides x Auxenochlorella symbiontica]